MSDWLIQREDPACEGSQSTRYCVYMNISNPNNTNNNNNKQIKKYSIKCNYAIW